MSEPANSARAPTDAAPAQMVVDDAVHAEEAKGIEVIHNEEHFDDLHVEELDIVQILRQHGQDGSLFEDPTFPATEASLYMNPGEYPPYQETGVGVSNWKRPEQIARGAAVFMENRPCGDVESGDINDRWLIGPAALLSTRPHLIAHLFSNTEYEREVGVVVVRLFKEGEWKEIIIDTRIPFSDAVEHRAPSYAHCVNKEEMWLPFLQKAFAKYKKSYEALDAGQTVADTLVDLTGGSVEQFDLGSPEVQQLVHSGEMWYFVKNWFTSGCLMGCQYEDLDVAELDSLRLVRIRNPWATTEWKGAFADHDQMWNKHPELKEKLDYEFGPDGTWWMRFEDWLTTYNQLYVVRMFPEHYQQQVHQSKWHGASAAGQPVPTTSSMVPFGDSQSIAGFEPKTPKSAPSVAASMNTTQPARTDPDHSFFRNPQFHIQVQSPEAQTIFFSLLQSEEGEMDNVNLLMLSAKKGRVWDFTDNDVMGMAIEPTGFTRVGTREVTFEVELKPYETGMSYVLIAYQDVPKPDASKCKNFFLRSFSSRPLAITEIPPPCTANFHGQWTANSAGGRRMRTAHAESTVWCRNPQLFLNFDKPTQLKIVLERVMGRKKTTANCGFSVLRAQDTAHVDQVQKVKKRGPVYLESLVKGAVHEMGHIERKLQVLQTDYCEETSFGMEDVACMHLTVKPEHGPIVIVPSLTEEGVPGNFNIGIYSDKPVTESCMLSDTNNKVCTGRWESDNAGGCHLHAPPFEKDKSMCTWHRNPKYTIKTDQRAVFNITLARTHLCWRNNVAKDQVGCMLGFYVIHGDKIERECVKDETTFVAHHEVSLSVTLEANESYCIVPCTYHSGKEGDFMLRVSGKSSFELEPVARKAPA